MFASLCLGPALCLLLPAGTDGPAGYLLIRPSAPEKAVRAKAIRYVPGEGDLIFYDDHSKAWTALFALAGTGPPLHMGIVVRKPGGSLAILEAGPDDTLWVDLLDLTPRLRQFRRDFRGTITIRRCKKALTPDQSAALTRFALAQKGKRYAALRLLAQGTAVRARGPLAPMLAKTHLNRDAWICSELAVAAGTVAGLFDRRAVRANATYPRDLVDNRRHDLGAVWEDAVEWRPTGHRGRSAIRGKGRGRGFTRPGFPPLRLRPRPVLR
jgi:hypothetical protein